MDTWEEHSGLREQGPPALAWPVRGTGRKPEWQKRPERERGVWELISESKWGQNLQTVVRLLL